jgi:hypothetical protein
MPSSSWRLMRRFGSHRFSSLPLLSIFAAFAMQGIAAAYVPIFGGPEYYATGYQTSTVQQLFAMNFVNNSGTAIVSNGSRLFQIPTTGSPPVPMNAPAIYGSDSTQRWGYAINDSGLAVGAAYDVNYGERPVRWDSSGAATELGNLGTRLGSTFTWGQAYAINNAGTVAGYSERWYGANNYDHAVRWNAGSAVATELGELPHAPSLTPYLKSRAVAVNESNTAVGWAQKLDSNGIDLGHRAVRWDGSGTAATELDNLAGYTDGEAVDVNESGTAVGCMSCGFQRTPVRWDSSGTAATQLATLGTGLNRVVAINDAGTAVGLSAGRAVRWGGSGTAVTELGHRGTDASGTAYDINNGGTIVGVSASRAVAWRTNDVAVDLNNLVDPASGWMLVVAYSISDANWIMGYGTFDPDGAGGSPAKPRYFTLQLPGPLAGDYNFDFVVDSADYVVWRRTFGQTGNGLAADGNSNGTVDDGDYEFWRSRVGTSAGSGAGASLSSAVPEGATLTMFLIGILTMRAGVRTQSHQSVMALRSSISRLRISRP